MFSSLRFQTQTDSVGKEINMIRFITSDGFLGGCSLLCVALGWTLYILGQDAHIGQILDCQSQLASELGHHPTVDDLDWMDAQCGGGR